jgi:hypothetical protein
LELEFREFKQTQAAEVLLCLYSEIEDADVPLVPHLPGIVLHCHREGEFSFNNLLRLLEMMVKRPNPLQHFRMEWTTPLLARLTNAQKIARFRALMTDGRIYMPQLKALGYRDIMYILIRTHYFIRETVPYISSRSNHV